jgi:hypothetical protein
MMAPRLLLGLALASVAAAQNNIIPFGTGLSQGTIEPTEKSLFFHSIAPTSTHGVLTHWWITGGGSIDDAIISFYIDGETVPSITFSPPMACGVGSNDETAPWSNEWMGKGAASGGWHNDFRIPFQSSINVTYRAGPGKGNDVIYMIVRGAENLPISIGGVAIPTTARMQLQVNSLVLAPLEYLNIVDVPYGSGLIFSTTLAFVAPNLNTLEGCFRLESPYSTPYPGMLLATGTEDYFDSCVLRERERRGVDCKSLSLSLLPGGTGRMGHSEPRPAGGVCLPPLCHSHLAPPPHTLPLLPLLPLSRSAYYFNAGPFRLATAGLTHISTNATTATLSAYRFHEKDPLVFSDGAKLVWRNGDATDPATGLKCFIETGGNVVGSPGNATVTTYAWVYTW